MYARATTLNAYRSAVDAGIAHVRDETMPALMQVQGCIGLSLLVDRDSGRCIVSTAWESQAAMGANQDRIGSLRAAAAQKFGGSVERVEEWEIAVLHREHAASDGACVRCTWLQGAPDRCDDMIEGFRADVLPEVESMDGFCSASMFIDRASGRCVAATAWDSRAAMAASRDRVVRLREATAARGAASIADVREFDLAVAHLRVPEMA
jgi:quinol monooxygenase YgiN